MVPRGLRVPNRAVPDSDFAGYRITKIRISDSKTPDIRPDT